LGSFKFSTINLKLVVYVSYLKRKSLGIYEAQYQAINTPDPIEAIKFRIEQAGLTYSLSNPREQKRSTG
jgi:antitoxin component HigA of HigAB toxin-antitoxin module